MEKRKMKIQDRKSELNFWINSLNDQIRLLERFPSNDRRTTKKLAELKREREALKIQVDNAIDWPPPDEQIPF